MNKKKAQYTEDKLEYYYNGIRNTILHFTGQDRIPVNDIEARFYERQERKLHGCI